MAAPQEGILCIADITGYTAFLSDSELEHAEDSLRSLLGLLIEQTRPPLVISRLEGDAVISFAPLGSFHQGQSLVELIETTYLQFRNARDKMVLNTTCPCKACRNLPNLDLKFFVHAGTYVLQPMANYTELVGSDVNLIHRLTKNSIHEDTGLQAYALYTEQAIAALAIPEMTANMVPHSERYEHLGEVHAFVQDLNATWERARSQFRVVVDRRTSPLVVEQDLPVAPAVAWDYLTKPEFRAILFGSDGQTLVSPTQRMGAGTVYQCVHGGKAYPHTILDWTPFDYYTYQETRFVPPGCRVLMTVRLEPIPTGTRVAIIGGRITGPLLLSALPNLIVPRVGGRLLAEGLRQLKDRIDADLLASPALAPSPVVIRPDQIEAAVQGGRSG